MKTQKILVSIVLFGIACLSNLTAIMSFEEGVGEKTHLLRRLNVVMFKEVYEAKNYEAAAKSEKEIIPKIIHQIWLGGEVPEKFLKLTESWKKMHPEWEYKLWTDEDVETFPFINEKAFFAATNYGMKADILRYEILRAYGGLYVDIDFECLKPMDIFHHAHHFYCGMDPQGIIGNSLIGCTPFHPIIESCIISISKLKRFTLSDDEIQMATGPFLLHFITANLMKRSVGDPVCYPTKFFFPFQYKNCKGLNFLDAKTQNRDLLLEDTHAIHYWAESWCEE